VNILFWNLGNNENSSRIKKLMQEHSVDIAIFAEHDKTDFIRLISECNNTLKMVYEYGGCKRIRTIIRSEYKYTVFQEESRYVIYEIDTKESRFIISAVHLQDRRNYDSSARIATIGRLVNDISTQEDKNKCKESIIIGDFNANPYDEELLQFNAFNAVLFKDVIRKSETRLYNERRYRRFYNPVLDFISETEMNYGSYYSTNHSSSPVWYCLDQALFSRSLVDSVMNFRYIRKIGSEDLVNTAGPLHRISDHLPLIVSVKEKGG